MRIFNPVSLITDIRDPNETKCKHRDVVTFYLTVIIKWCRQCGGIKYESKWQYPNCNNGYRLRLKKSKYDF